MELAKELDNLFNDLKRTPKTPYKVSRIDRVILKTSSRNIIGTFKVKS